MAYDALEQWRRLNKCINVKHYIGANAHKCIQDELEAPRTKKVSMQIAEEPVVKAVRKAAKKAPKKSED